MVMLQRIQVLYCVVGWAVPDVLRDHSLYIFRVKQSEKNDFICLIPKKKAHFHDTRNRSPKEMTSHLTGLKSSVYQPHCSASECVTLTTKQNDSQWLTQTAECITTGRPVRKTYAAISGTIQYVSCEWQQQHFSPYPSNGTSSCFPHVTVKDLVWIFPKWVLLMFWQQL